MVPRPDVDARSIMIVQRRLLLGDWDLKCCQEQVGVQMRCSSRRLTLGGYEGPRTFRGQRFACLTVRNDVPRFMSVAYPAEVRSGRRDQHTPPSRFVGIALRSQWLSESAAMTCRGLFVGRRQRGASGQFGCPALDGRGSPEVGPRAPAVAGRRNAATRRTSAPEGAQPSRLVHSGHARLAEDQSRSPDS